MQLKYNVIIVETNVLPDNTQKIKIATYPQL